MTRPTGLCWRGFVLSCWTMQGKTDVHVEGEVESSGIADAAQAGRNNRHGIEFGEGSKIPAGAFVVMDARKKRGDADKARIINGLRRPGVEKVAVLMRPRHSKKRPALLDAFGKALFEKDVATLAREQSLSIEDIADNMLLCLYDALLLELADSWTRQGVANLPSADTHELARYWIIGQNSGSKPIFDGLGGNPKTCMA